MLNLGFVKVARGYVHLNLSLHFQEYIKEDKNNICFLTTKSHSRVFLK